MKRFLIILSLVISTSVLAQDPNFHIYLCFGQSNMEGSAEICDVDRLPNERLLAMASMDYDNGQKAKGQWYIATPPLSQQYAGLAPSDGFGKYMVKSLPDSIKVGLISVAIGGCDIRVFDKDIYKDFKNTYPQDWFQNKLVYYGGNPYERLMYLAKEAQKAGVIKGILVHQGETNTGDEQWPNYLNKIYQDMLSELGIDVPIFIGEVVNKTENGKCAQMNPIINKAPEVISNAYVISSKNIGDRGDRVHFDSEGVRELGKRYAEQTLKVVYDL